MANDCQDSLRISQPYAGVNFADGKNPTQFRTPHNRTSR
jgi:hypothetical protein